MSGIAISVVIAIAAIIIGGVLGPVWEYLLFKVRSKNAKIPDLKGQRQQTLHPGHNRYRKTARF
jgi:hypothetical protein